MEDYYGSSFYFHAGLFQLESSGVTHLCTASASAAAAAPPHPKCDDGEHGGGGGGTRAPARFSAYRFHHRDPLWFSGGAQLLARNGDTNRATPWGGIGKCYNLDLSNSSDFELQPSCQRTHAFISGMVRPCMSRAGAALHARPGQEPDGQTGLAWGTASPMASPRFVTAATATTWVLSAPPALSREATMGIRRVYTP